MKKLITLLVLLIFLFSVRIYAATTTGQFGVGNAAPQFVPVTGITNDASTTAVPTNEGTAVTFTATATDDNNDQWYLLICGSAGVTNGVCNSNPICTATTTPVSSGVQSSCTHSTTGELSESYSWYAYACDKIGSPSCTADANANSPYYVNHRPYASSISVTPPTVYETSTLTCSYTFNDGDVTPQDTESGTVFQWWKVGTPDTQIAGQTTSTLTGASFNKGDVIYCKVLVRDNHAFTDSVYRQSSNQVTILNSVPTQPTGFQVQHGAATWDSGVPPTTHDNTPSLKWTVTDADGDAIKTSVCISDPSVGGGHTCDKVNYVPATCDNVKQYDVVSALAYSGASKTYNVDLTPNDCTAVGTGVGTSFNLINSQPVVNSFTPTTTHNPSQTVSWTATDADDGSDDHWPADSLSYHTIVKQNSDYTGTTYLDYTGTEVSRDITTPIPWGTPSGGVATTTTYFRVTATDTPGWTSTNYDGQLQLIDNLPVITQVKLGDTIIGATDCAIPTCSLSPQPGTVASLGTSITFTDSDNDCGAGVNNVRLTLCFDSVSCSEGAPTNRYGPFTLTFASGGGGTCTFELSTSTGTPDFFKAPASNYKAYALAGSQAGSQTTSPTWQYSTLKAIDYVGSVFLGDGTIDLNIWNPGINLYTMTNYGNAILTLDWKATDPISGGSSCSGHTSTCWDLTTADDFQVDDDGVQGGGDGGNLAAVAIPETPTSVGFNPSGGLKICSTPACNSGAGEKLATYFHIKPPLGLQPGTYSTTITITPS